MLEIAERLDESKIDMQLIMICGRNQELARTLRNRNSRCQFSWKNLQKKSRITWISRIFLLANRAPAASLKHSRNICHASSLQMRGRFRRNATTRAGFANKQVGLAISNFSEIANAVGELLVAANIRRISREHNPYSQQRGIRNSKFSESCFASGMRSAHANVRISAAARSRVELASLASNSEI